MGWWAEKDHFGSEHREKTLRALHITQVLSSCSGLGWLPQLWAPHHPVQMLSPALLAGALIDKAPHSDPSFSTKFINQPGLSLLCNWQRKISKCLNLNLNLVIPAMFASGLKFTSHHHTAVSLLSFIPPPALPLLLKCNNGFFWSVWCFPVLFFCAVSSFISRRVRTQSQTWDTINLSWEKKFWRPLSYPVSPRLTNSGI